MNLKFFLNIKTIRHFISTYTTVLIACFVLFSIQSKIKLTEFNPAVHKQKILNAQFFKFTTMGYWSAAVDWMWIQTLQAVGSDTNTKESIPFLKSFYEIATDLDPKFYELYEQSGVFFSFSMNSSDESIYFLEKGIKVNEELKLTEQKTKGWTHSYTLNLIAAYLYSYQKNNWVKAKEYYLKAAEIPGAPLYLKNMETWLKEDGSEKLLAIRVLKILIQSTEDPVLKQKFIEKLNSYE